MPTFYHGQSANASAFRESGLAAGPARRILVAAADPTQLVAIQQAFDLLRPDWAVYATRDGDDALAAADDDPPSVVVVDHRVRGTTPEDLLVEVRRRHPRAVRIALAPTGDPAAVVRLLSMANRVLPRTADAVTLQEAVRRAHSLREVLWSPVLTTVVGRLGSIPTLSAVYNRIAAELSRPDFSLAKVGELVDQDAGMAAKLMQVANSALMGLRRPAATPSQAVRVLGADLTRTLILAADLFSRYDPASLRPFSIEALWDHSRKVSDLAGRIATEARAGDRVIREAALAGLLHDIGRLAIVSQLPGPYKEVLTLMRADGVPAATAERRVLGSTHAEVGAYLLGLWGLPDPIVEAVAWHHDPADCPGDEFSAVTAVHLAETLAPGDEAAVADDDYLERFPAEAVEAWRAVADVRPESDSPTSPNGPAASPSRAGDSLGKGRQSAPPRPGTRPGGSPGRGSID